MPVPMLLPQTDHEPSREHDTDSVVINEGQLNQIDQDLLDPQSSIEYTASNHPRSYEDPTSAKHSFDLDIIPQRNFER